MGLADAFYGKEKKVKTHIKVGDFKRVNTLFDEDLERETDVKTSAVHFCRFEFNEAAKKPLNTARKLL